MSVAWRSSAIGRVLRPTSPPRHFTTWATAAVQIQQPRPGRGVEGTVLTKPGLPQGSAKGESTSETYQSHLESPGRYTDTLQDPPEQVPLHPKARRTLDRFEYVPDDVIKEFEAKLEGDLQSVFATLFAGIGVITWWRGVWALLDHYIGDSVFGHWICVITGLMIILYIRFSGYKLTNFFPPS